MISVMALKLKLNVQGSNPSDSNFLLEKWGRISFLKKWGQKFVSSTISIYSASCTLTGDCPPTVSDFTATAQGSLRFPAATQGKTWLIYVLKQMHVNTSKPIKGFPATWL